MKRGLLLKSQEAALNAVQTFNNPLTTFKTETFIVLMVIAWTYLLHAHYRHQGIEYRYYTQGPKRRKFCHPRPGTFRYWDLARCIDEPACPLDEPTKRNLRFLLGLRNEITHHTSAGLDEAYTARYVACCLNYERELTRLFGQRYSIGSRMKYSLSLGDLTSPTPSGGSGAQLPQSIEDYVRDFDNNTPSDELQHEHFAYRLKFERRTINNASKADRVIEFLAPDSELAEDVPKEYWVKQERERRKFLFGEIKQIMHQEGHTRFNQYNHTQLWKKMGAKNEGKGYGVTIGNTWYWYQAWVDEVRRHCETHRDSYSDH